MQKAAQAACPGEAAAYPDEVATLGEAAALPGAVAAPGAPPTSSSSIHGEKKT